MRKTIYSFLIISLFSCEDTSVVNGENNQVTEPDVVETTEDSIITVLDKEIISNYDVSEMDKTKSVEFKKSLIEIEKEHGVQWDFCTCVVKNDSINKAFENDLSDSEFDRLSLRFDQIDEKCKAFLVQNSSQTPEDRAKHQKDVSDCLKANK